MTWQMSSFVLLALALAAGFAWYERKRPPARVVGVVAVLAALAVVGRLAFAAVPNVKPTTDIVLFAGYALGAAPGFAVGAIGAIASNVFLGQGPWTVWQMAAWGGVGIGGALLAWGTRGRELGRVELAIYCGVAGFAFGALMDVYQWTLAARQDLSTYLAIAATSLPYNIAHAIGNVVFCLLIGPVFVRSLRRYRRRFEVTWAAPAVRRGTAGGAVAAVVAGLAVITALSVPAPSVDVAHAAPGATTAASAPVRAAIYLRRSQNRDGGFAGSPGQSSSTLMTGWSALGLASAGLNPRDVKNGKRGRSAIDYLRSNSRSLGDVGELQRTILVLRAAGLSPRRFAGADLVAKLRRAQSANGSWKSNTAWTAFGLLALRAAREPLGSERVRKAADFLEAAQAPGGGWGFAPGSPADVDDTGAVLQALASAGRRGAAARAGVDYLRGGQGADGGWGQLAGRDSNAQSTSWAVQGLVAMRAPLGSLHADPLAYLRGLQRRDGHIAYSRTSDQTPIWVTAQAIAALQRKPFPLPPVKRGKAAALLAAAASADRGSGGDGPGPAVVVVAGIAAAAALAAAIGWRVRRQGATA
ncbi:MAG TPA: prenyltransferase/squalene oxidase repeat-containing protein [Thermoleophilaceae bacterium]|nr:prenyltransferase/squalene oxidase repeat-containing protein [Thermoleophilaceae bacterium]